MVGRVPIFLLDTDHEQNDPADRPLCHRLYAGGPDLRLRQEWILGVGGVRVLRALGYHPAAWHSNEGHAAFMLVERVRELVMGGTPFAEAVRQVRATSIFTTHTPVPAGHDTFSPDQVAQCAGPVWQEMGVNRDELFRLGHHPALDHDRFHMSVAAIRLSARVNAVSRRHAEESRRIWAPLWPGRAAEAVPIKYVTNGAHVATWMANSMVALLESHLGADWWQRVDDPAVWARLVNPWRPVQIVFAGKAHPGDEPGKQILQRVYAQTREARFEGRIAFIEDYDMHVAHSLVQGVDLWLNLPRAPLEASGTSGMKAALNAVPQLSTLDGWWAEGYDGRNGWAIPAATAATAGAEGDAADAERLYRLLEDEVVPLFYTRDARDVPLGWTETMKHALRAAGQHFTARRMLREYVTEHYVPAIRGQLPADDPPGA